MRACRDLTCMVAPSTGKGLIKLRRASGMSADTREYLIDRVCGLMRTMTKARATDLAGSITAAVNRSLAGLQHPVSEFAPVLLDVIPINLRTKAALDIGWEALNRSFDGDSASVASEARADLVCSLPRLLSDADGMREAIKETGIWPGSLIDGVNQLFLSVKKDLVIVSPYWSREGVNTVIRHLTRERFTGVDITVITQPREDLDRDAIEGISTFKLALDARSAVVKVLAPRKTFARVPLMHAKTVIQDNERAYIGSANISLSGIEQNFELGVMVGGRDVHTLRKWVGALSSCLSDW